MNKKILAGCLSLLLLLCAGSAVYADETSADWNVRFTQDNVLDSDFTASNLSSKVYELQPGDTVNLTLHLQNDNADPANWYMTNKVLRSLEDAGNSASGGAYEYKLTFTAPDGSEEILYESDTVGGEQTARADDRVGLEFATEGLEDFFYLDTLEPGERATVRLRVSLDGETQGNDYQNTLAQLQLNFAVDPVVNRTETVRRLNVVQTGDQNRMLPFLIAAGVSGVLLLILALAGVKERKKMKKAAEKTLCLLLLGALCFTAVSAPAVSAAETTYTVRLFAGVQGVVSGVDGGLVNEDGAIEITGLRYGDRVALDPWSLIRLPQNSKYTIKGIRMSGEDELISRLDFPVTGDQDYVVVYGVQGDMVSYTVQYLDEAGNELAPSDEFRGNVGDRPIVAYRYIEGYRPQAYNLIGWELSEDASKNVFSFVYTPIDVNTVTVIEEPGVTVIRGNEGTIINDEPTPLTPVPEVVDLNDEPTPLADWKISEILKDFATPFMNLPMAARIAISAGIVGLGIGLILLITKKRKEKDAQDG